MKNKVLKIIIISIFILTCLQTYKYCAIDETVKMKITNDGDVWTNISVSDSFEECEYLNSNGSTLGTTLLKAHLTTDYDWSAMAIFSVSQYGAATKNNPESTTGNKTGIYNVGKRLTQTTGILKGATETNSIKAVCENLSSPYVNEWNLLIEENDFVGFNGTYGWLSSWKNYGNITTHPISIKNGLFGVLFCKNTNEVR